MRKVVPVLVGALVWTAACSDTGPSADSFVGTWRATKMEFVRVANPSETVDLIADLGGSFTITFSADSTWEAIQTVPSVAPDTVDGHWSVSLDVLTLTQTGQSGNRQFTFVLSGDTITLTGGDVEWDFGSGDEAATLSITLTKQ
jgi:hypothetical protein